jgi:hypothetical protein
VPPLIALVLGGLGVLGESTSVWLAMGIGVLTLGVAGVRYAQVESLGRLGTAITVGINLGFGLLIVALEVALSH